MIDGLKLTVSGEELRTLLEQRMDDHLRRADRWKREQARAPEEQTEDELGFVFELGTVFAARRPKSPHDDVIVIECVVEMEADSSQVHATEPPGFLSLDVLLGSGREPNASLFQRDLSTRRITSASTRRPAFTSASESVKAW
jgi:hypothetical protein